MLTRLRRIAVAIVLLCVCFMAGCAVAPVATREMDARGRSFTVAEGKANIYLYRNENLSASPMQIFVNGAEAGATGRATYLLWEVDPGAYDISSGSDNTSSVRIVAEAGKSYYVWQMVKLDRRLVLLDIVIARSELHIVDEDMGRWGVSECSRVQSKL